MARSTRDNTKKRAEQKGTLIGVRLQPAALVSLDDWARAQADENLTRPEAIRQLIEAGLAASGQERGGRTTQSKKVSS
jgi:hypothetical protein